MTICKLCGANLAIVGRTHRCIPRPVTNVTNSEPVTNKPVSNKRPRVSNRKPVPEVSKAGVKKDQDRVQRWRAKNRERYNAYMRELMRKRRAEWSSVR